MMPRDIGGVVDVNHTVYGTANVRVVDASALLFQVCGSPGQHSLCRGRESGRCHQEPATSFLIRVGMYLNARLSMAIDRIGGNASRFEQGTTGQKRVRKMLCINYRQKC
jgi:hypothetical protein